jgi:hypothetical protein
VHRPLNSQCPERPTRGWRRPPPFSFTSFFWVFRQMRTCGSDFCPEGAAYNSPGSEKRHPGVATPTRTSSYPVALHSRSFDVRAPCNLIRILFLCYLSGYYNYFAALLSPGWRASDPGLPFAALSGQETQNPPQGEYTADRCCPFSSAGTRLPDEPALSR